SNLYLYSTNLRLSLLDVCPAMVEKEGVIAIDAKKISEIIKESPEEEIIIEEKEENRIKISSGNVVYNLPKSNHLDFPQKTITQPNSTSKIMATKLNEMIKKTIFAVAEDEGRGALGGILFEVINNKDRHLRLVATDAHRLSCIEKKEDKDEVFKDELRGIIIPRKGIQELRRLIEDIDDHIIDVWRAENIIFIKIEKTILSIQLIEGEFPEYKRVLSFCGEYKIKLSTKRVLESLKRVAVVLDDRFRYVKIALYEGKLIIGSYGSEAGEANEFIDVNYSGEKKEIYFNLRYLLDSFGCLEDDVILEIKGAKDPVRILPEKDNKHILIVMPMVF
ncbi:MAG: DNA polymerase III subunit beta, partial [Minisyncoccia bacterium]